MAGSNSDVDPGASPKGNGRMMLLLIGGIPLTLVLTATWLWYFVVEGDIDLIGMLGTANRGNLVEPPRQLADMPLQDASGQPLKFGDLEPRWRMLVPGAKGVCAAACEKSLYVTRQIHVAMGKDFNRLQRLYVSTSTPADTQVSVATLSDQHPVPASFAQYLGEEHKGLQAIVLAHDSYQTLFAEHVQNPDTWYLVDPAGWIMMSYNGEIPYKDVLSDLKFLLKNSGG